MGLGPRHPQGAYPVCSQGYKGHTPAPAAGRQCIPSSQIWKRSLKCAASDSRLCVPCRAAAEPRPGGLGYASPRKAEQGGGEPNTTHCPPGAAVWSCAGLLSLAGLQDMEGRKVPGKPRDVGQYGGGGGKAENAACLCGASAQLGRPAREEPPPTLRAWTHLPGGVGGKEARPAGRS